jgi:hypothetical protein
MFSINIIISEENYNNNTQNINNKAIILNNIEVDNIYNDEHFLDILPSLELDDKLLLEKFPLLVLINIDKNQWSKYNFSNILVISDFKKDNLEKTNNLTFLKKQSSIMRYFFVNINKLENGNEKLIIFLALLDFCIKTIKINNKRLNKTIKDKIKDEKIKLLEIIDNNLFDKIYELFEKYSE